MRKGVFAPYTKQKAVYILRKYFGLTIEKANLEAERLAACVVRDGLNASKYLYLWENKILMGKHGKLAELEVLYPANRG